MNINQRFNIQLLIITSCILGLVILARCQVTPLQVPYKGVVNKYNPTIIADDSCSDLVNMYIDKTGGVSKRNGSIAYDNSTPISGNVRGLYEYVKSNGSKYFLKVVGSSLCSSSGDGNWNVLISTLNVNYDPDFATFLDYAWITDGIDDVYFFDGSVIVSSPTIPKFKYIEVYQNRMFGALNNSSAIYYYGLYSMFGTAAYSIDYVNRDDGDIITGLKTYNGVLYVPKSNSMHEIVWKYALNIDNDSFIIRQISTEYGCLYNTSLCEFNGEMCFWSKKGIVSMEATTDGEAKFTIRSTPIYGELRNLDQTINRNSYSWVQTTTNDFGQGRGVNIDTTSISGSIKMLDCTTNYSSFNLYLSTDDTQVGSQIDFKVDETTSSAFIPQYSMTLSSVSIYLDRTASIAGSFYIKILNSVRTIVSSSTFYWDNSGTGYFDYSFQSKNISLNKNSTYYLVIGSTWSWDGGDSPWINIDEDPTAPPFPTKPFTLLSFKVFGITPIQRYSQFQSQIFNATDASVWGLFFKNDNTNGGNIQYFVSVATASVFVSSMNLISIANNALINSTSVSYVMVFASMTSSLNGNTPRIDDFTVWYSKLSGFYTPIPSISYDDHLFIAVTTPSMTFNGRMYVASREWVWTKFEGIYPYSMSMYNGYMYTGDGNGLGYVRRMNVDGKYDDGSSPINTSMISKNYHFGLPDQDKSYDKIYLNFNSNGITSDILAEYCLDGTNVFVGSQTIRLSGSKDMQNVKIPFKLQSGNRGKYFKLKLTNNTTGQYWDWQGGNVYYTPVAPQ